MTKHYSPCPMCDNDNITLEETLTKHELKGHYYNFIYLRCEDCGYEFGDRDILSINIKNSKVENMIKQFKQSFPIDEGTLVCVLKFLEENDFKEVENKQERNKMASVREAVYTTLESGDVVNEISISSTFNYSGDGSNIIIVSYTLEEDLHNDFKRSCRS